MSGAYGLTIKLRTALLEEPEDSYVYELIDPRDNRPFYVGKGKGKRLHKHEGDALSGKRTGLRHLRIIEIKKAGLEIRYNIVAEGLDEQEAYDLEARRVEEIGLDNLTNQKAGGGSARPCWDINSFRRTFLDRHWTPLKSIKDEQKQLAIFIAESVENLANLLVDKWGSAAHDIRDITHDRVQSYLAAK